MSSREGERLVGLAKNMSWIYLSPDKSQTVIVMFDGVTVREARRLKMNEGKTALLSKQDAAQTYVGLPAPGTSAASVVRLLGLLYGLPLNTLLIRCSASSRTTSLCAGRPSRRRRWDNIA